MIHVYIVHLGNISNGRFWFSRSDAGPKTLPSSLPPFLLFPFFLSFFFFFWTLEALFLNLIQTEDKGMDGWTWGQRSLVHPWAWQPCSKGQTGGLAWISIVCSATLPACLKGKLATLGFRLMAPPTVGRQRYPEPLASEGLHSCRSFWSLNCSFLDTKNRFIKSLVRSLG